MPQLGSKPFSNNFVEMNIPDSWECGPYMGEIWACQPIEKNNEVIIVMTFADQGPNDSLNDFYKYMSQSIMVSTDPTTGKQHPSKPINMQYKSIMGQQWVDSQHLSTALPNYLTRYLTTIKDGRVVLVAITVEKDLYTKYMAELYKTVESMKLRTTFPAEPIQTGLMGLIGSLKDDPGKKKESAKGYVNIEVSKGGNWGLALFLALLAVAVVFYIIRRRRRNKGKTAKKPLFR
jgi:hypothetical protein